MTITGVEYKDGVLAVHTPSKAEAAKLVYGFKPGEYEIIKSRKKRSLDANAYCWELIGQIAAAMAIDKNTVYRDAICAVGVFDSLYIKSEAYDDFNKHWSEKGLGWVAVKMDENRDMSYVQAYYGSSVYSVSEMSVLIDYIVQEAQSIGIETLSERERSLLLEEWGAAKA